MAGYSLSLHAPSSIQTALALRQAIWRKGDPHWSVCGIPETFYTDHGSDFTSHHLEQVAADLHMALVFSIAGKPRGRGLALEGLRAPGLRRKSNMTLTFSLSREDIPIVVFTRCPI